MFDGVPEQLHQFIASSRTPLVPLSFSSLHHHHHYHHHHHGSSNPNDDNTTIFQAFDPFTSSTNSSLTIQVPLQVQAASFLHPFNQQSQAQKSSHEEDHQKQAARSTDDISLVGVNNNNLEINIERSESCNNPAAAAWSNDEVLSLLRVRSSLDVNWFPESIWEHVSRKLEELGYKRTAEKCKEKFEEEESRYLSNINYNKSHCRSFNEFFDDEEVYTNNNDDGDGDGDENSSKLEKQRDEVPVVEVVEQLQDKELLDGLKDSKDEKRKRKRRVDEEDQFEMLKGFCEDVVKKMMVKQEEMYQKLLEDMVRRDEEKFAREETRKKQEMDRVDKELQGMAHEQAIAGDRQATLVKFLNSFTATSMSSPPSKNSSSSDNHQNQNQCLEERTSSEDHQTTPHSSSLILAHNPNNPSTGTQAAANIDVQKNPSSKNFDHHHHPKAQNPNSPIVITNKKPLSPTSVSTHKNAHQNPSIISKTNDRDHDVGKRWPRDEVFALINLRCSLQNDNNNGDHHQDNKKESGGGQAAKIPLWERISQGMSQLGYKRSAKRCKEKWENINKYFRKTKDANKKRSLDSRTCPYFHQLTTLYNTNNQGTVLVPPPSSHEKKAAAAGGNRPAALPENHSTPSSQPGSSTDSSIHAAASGGGHDQQGEKILVQVPTFDFEF